MKRLEANMRKKCESAKIKLRIDMVHSALKTAKLKAEEKLFDADARLQHAMERLGEETNITSILNDMVGYFNDKEDAEAEIALAKKLKAYLYDEVEVDPETDKVD